MKSTAKWIAEALATLLVLPAAGLYTLDRLFFGANRVFAGWSQLFSLIPGLGGAYLRRAFYRFAFLCCDSGATIGFGTIFSHAACSISRNVYVGAFCCIGEVTLEEDVLIGSHVSITNGGAQHGIERLDVPIREQPGTWPHITIGRDTWIGDRTVVMANVGRHCVIGAGSVVTKPIPDYAIAVGSPARVVRYRTSDQASNEDGETPTQKAVNQL